MPYRREILMRVLVVADTHIPVRARTIPEVIVEEAKKADVIFHCGDFVAESVYYEFQAFGKPLHAVFGNMDDPAVSAMLPGKKIVTLEGVKIGLVHGYGSAEGIEERVRKIFEDAQVDAIFFGHSHRPLMQHTGGIFLLNPGSPTDTIFAPKKSFAIVHIEGREISGQIIEIA